MKRLSYLFSLLFLMSFVVFTSCKDDNPEPGEKPPAEEATEKLIGTWNITSVTRAGEDVLGDATVTITFGESSYSASGASGVMPGDDPAFPTTGTWEFPDANTVNQIIINGSAINFNAVSISATSVSFQYTTTDAKSEGEDVTISVSATKQ